MDHPLVSTCHMWCLMTETKPVPCPDINRGFLESAVRDYARTGKTFESLNDHQRRMIAGLAEK